MKDEEIIKIIKDTIEELPQDFKRKLKDVEIFVKDYPEGDHADSVLGIFKGIPLTRKTVFSLYLHPDTIVIYRKNVEKFSRNEEEAKSLLKRVLLHEIGHYFGLSERDLRRLGY